MSTFNSYKKTWKSYVAVGAPLVFSFIVACGGGDDDPLPAMLQTLTATCTQAGGSVQQNGQQNCDFSAVVGSKAGGQISSADKGAQQAIASQNSHVADSCAKAAQLSALQCKFNQLQANQKACQDVVNNVIGTLTAFNKNQGNGAGSSSTDIFPLLLASGQSAPNGANCKDQLFQAFSTYQTAWNGAFANSSAGCSFLTANMGKLVNAFKSQTDYATQMQLTALASTMASGSCPAATVMQSLIGFLGTGPSTSTTVASTNGSNPSGLLPLTGFSGATANTGSIAGSSTASTGSASTLGTLLGLGAKQNNANNQAVANQPKQNAAGLQQSTQRGVTLVY